MTLPGPTRKLVCPSSPSPPYAVDRDRCTPSLRPGGQHFHGNPTGAHTGEGDYLQHLGGGREKVSGPQDGKSEKSEEIADEPARDPGMPGARGGLSARDQTIRLRGQRDVSHRRDGQQWLPCNGREECTYRRPG
ncbi:hypothetical protein TNCV_1077021 [Trichonephila clavipes]|uniref:Uncharacterized protein n=1 Tax=Trichonephila clavipes TaxID=2585209 RepID=A0A8X6RL17_TRICX|nr:hypothetical protein TNCV_1077021 [Trichonephila clavipes]